MGALDEAGQKTAADLNQYVHSWLDDLAQRFKGFQEILEGHRIRFKGDATIEIEEKEPK